MIETSLYYLIIFFDRFCSLTTGLSEEINDESFKIYPNPFSYELNISNLKHDDITFILYDNLSNKILEDKLSTSTMIVTDQLSSGIYFYEIWNSKQQIAAGKVIKK